MSRRARRNAERAPPPDIPLFSERLTALLELMFKGEAPNSGRFCGYCYSPLAKDRMHCPHCRRATQDHPPVRSVPNDVLQMFQRLRRRESLVVNSFAYLGLLLGVFIFIGVFYVIFSLGGSVWWYVFDIVLLFVAARGLAGLLGGWIGDDLGFRYARRKLAEEWQAYEGEQKSSVVSC